MRIYGMKKERCKGMWVVYIIENKSKYFLSVFSNKEKAQEVARKWNAYIHYVR